MAATVRSIAAVCLVQLAGCGGMQVIAPSSAIADRAPVVAVAPSAVPGAPELTAPRSTEPEPPAVEPVPSAPRVEEKIPAKAPEQPAKAPAKVIAPPVAAVPVRKAEEPPAAAKAEPPLDVTALKARLRDTVAIGVFAKLTLRSQVDELVESFRIHYEGGQKSSLAALRKPYDALVMKVLDLLQEGDPPLARSIASSREAIWGILVDREKFQSVK